MKRILLLLLLLNGAATARAQNTYVEAGPMNVAVTVRGGVTLGTPRGDFPSLIVGESSRRGTGEIGQQYGRSETGARVEVAALIPFDPALGVSVGLGSQSLAVSYDGDTSRYATLFEFQTLQANLGVQWSFFREDLSYQHGGLRSIYLDAGIDASLAVLADRVESTAYGDTLGLERMPVDGSFENNDPFRAVIALRGGVGARFAATPNIEVVAETWYAHSLNPLFSSDAIEDSDFAIDVMAAVVGIGYRF